MLSFCGQDKTCVDSNGRVRFGPKLITSFMDNCNGEVVLHCLPEGALAIYPEDIYLEMRRAESRPAEKASSSMVFRRNLRRFGALSTPEKISRQGRITIPGGYREMLELNPGQDVMIVGVEIGVEIWNATRWNNELKRIETHMTEKGEREMAADLEDPRDRNQENES